MTLLLGFPDEAAPAQRLAAALQLEYAPIEVHRFPDGENRLTLPPALPPTVVLYRSLDHPDAKLVELLLATRAARELGAERIILVSPYLCYMRQDKAFHPGEAVSQRIIGRFLADLVDAVITVDAHLHRIARLDEAIPLPQAHNLSAAPLLGRFLLEQTREVLMLGPDEESRQWVEQVARQGDFDFGVADKVRRGDRQVAIRLPDREYRQRHVVLVDDMISSGHTLAVTARQLYNAGTQRVDALCTHALYDDNAAKLLKEAGIETIWSADSVHHPSNAVQLAPLLAAAVRKMLN
ncbi:ribose-phosphate diphosphokinase [Thiohalophilus thiocyanatoxydans]|uniref:Ribose-phosphate pyrophosphokinase n=1 Tax=Thiohalophilus thiocyanatoxydans TaxID=381308 RepID=A0A4R8ILI6_9GAMM|nr:ribose-phosphate diphosphokinase [Thiohalophilus thiocyanatoxydans]TDY01656.1 ribose-phosphate pyrophosphokinase [Thiohalophilus thiocyanatoxydans]